VIAITGTTTWTIKSNVVWLVSINTATSIT